MAVELGSVSLDHLTRVDVRERARIAAHPVPGMSGDLAQSLGRASVVVRLRGIVHGDTAADDLKSLRQVFLAGDPVDFFADAVGEGYFAQVLISTLEVSQRAGAFDQFDFVCEVVEYVEPPQPAAADVFGGLDAGLLDEAGAFMDDVQNALDEVSGLTDLLANVPSFGDPTTKLPQMSAAFTDTVAKAPETLGAILELI